VTPPRLGVELRRPVIRQSTLDDRRAVEAMVDRCGPKSLLGRFHLPVRSAPPGFVDQVTTAGPDHRALLAVWDGAVVGIGEWHRSSPTSAELAVLVEDAWQGYGIGIALVRRTTGDAKEDGITVVEAFLLGENADLIRPLNRLGSIRVRWDWGVAEVHVTLADDRRTSLISSLRQQESDPHRRDSVGLPAVGGVRQVKDRRVGNRSTLSGRPTSVSSATNHSSSNQETT
jgi:N-acetylglutamate synthase-like GNAT family acetyltransferase